MSDKTYRYIPDMNVQCSLQMRNFDAPALAMSDCCGQHANSGVKLKDGKIMWRCNKHAGLRPVDDRGFALEIVRAIFYV